MVDIKKDKKKKKTDLFYLCAPLALIVFILRDIISGFNLPGYNWVTQPIEDFAIMQSRSFVFSIIFCVIFVILFVVSCFSLYKYFKVKSNNKLIKKGFIIFMIMAIIFSLTSFVSVGADTGVLSKVKEYTKEVTKTETVQVDNQDANQENGSEQGSEEVKTEDKTVLDEEATAENYQKLADFVTSNPFVLAMIIGLCLTLLLSIISLLLFVIGGFGKKGILLIGVVSLVCLTMIIYAIVSIVIFEPNTLGINTRIYTYAPIIFSAIIGSYLYIIYEEK